jgi:hypothetical protein
MFGGIKFLNRSSSELVNYFETLKKCLNYLIAVNNNPLKYRLVIRAIIIGTTIRTTGKNQVT